MSNSRSSMGVSVPLSGPSLPHFRRVSLIEPPPAPPGDRDLDRVGSSLLAEDRSRMRMESPLASRRRSLSESPQESLNLLYSSYSTSPLFCREWIFPLEQWRAPPGHRQVELEGPSPAPPENRDLDLVSSSFTPDDRRRMRRTEHVLTSRRRSLSSGDFDLCESFLAEQGRTLPDNRRSSLDEPPHAPPDPGRTQILTKPSLATPDRHRIFHSEALSAPRSYSRVSLSEAPLAPPDRGWNGFTNLDAFTQNHHHKSQTEPSMESDTSSEKSLHLSSSEPARNVTLPYGGYAKAAQVLTDMSDQESVNLTKKRVTNGNRDFDKEAMEHADEEATREYWEPTEAANSVAEVEISNHAAEERAIAAEKAREAAEIKAEEADMKVIAAEKARKTAEERAIAAENALAAAEKKIKDANTRAARHAQARNAAEARATTAEQNAADEKSTEDERVRADLKSLKLWTSKETPNVSKPTANTPKPITNVLEDIDLEGLNLAALKMKAQDVNISEEEIGRTIHSAVEPVKALKELITDMRKAMMGEDEPLGTPLENLAPAATPDFVGHYALEVNLSLLRPSYDRKALERILGSIFGVMESDVVVRNVGDSVDAVVHFRLDEHSSSAFEDFLTVSKDKLGVAARGSICETAQLELSGSGSLPFEKIGKITLSDEDALRPSNAPPTIRNDVELLIKEVFKGIMFHRNAKLCKLWSILLACHLKGELDAAGREAATVRRSSDEEVTNLTKERDAARIEIAELKQSREAETMRFRNEVANLMKELDAARTERVELMKSREADAMRFRNEAMRTSVSAASKQGQIHAMAKVAEYMWKRHGPINIMRQVFFELSAVVKALRRDKVFDKECLGNHMKKNVCETLWKLRGPLRYMNVAIRAWKEMLFDEKARKAKTASMELLESLEEARAVREAQIHARAKVAEYLWKHGDTMNFIRLVFSKFMAVARESRHDSILQTAVNAERDMKRILAGKMWLRYGRQAIFSSVFRGWSAICGRAKNNALREAMTASANGVKDKVGEILWFYRLERCRNVVFYVWRERVCDEKILKSTNAAYDLLEQANSLKEELAEAAEAKKSGEEVAMRQQSEAAREAAEATNLQKELADAAEAKTYREEKAKRFDQVKAETRKAEDHNKHLITENLRFAESKGNTMAQLVEIQRSKQESVDLDTGPSF